MTTDSVVRSALSMTDAGARVNRGVVQFRCNGRLRLTPTPDTKLSGHDYGYAHARHKPKKIAETAIPDTNFWRALAPRPCADSEHEKTPPRD
jgi:hypothetical protein